jgi:phospholipid-binding lipoprotein MlaA
LPVSEGKYVETISSDEKDTAEDAINEDEDWEDWEDWEDEEWEDDNDEIETTSIKDPFQPYNRAIFIFNDKTYYYVVKPMYKGYNTVMPEKVRLRVRKFFSNIKTPGRLFNCLFQGKFKGAGVEALRFTINSTVGVVGLFDPARTEFNLDKQDEDFGQTLGKYEMGPGFFIEWPLLGPSNIRDTLGYVGDAALDPLTILSFFVNPLFTSGANSYNTFNEISLDKGDAYESITKPAIDPYIALQDAYTQSRIKKIKE